MAFPGSKWCAGNILSPGATVEEQSVSNSLTVSFAVLIGRHEGLAVPVSGVIIATLAAIAADARHELHPPQFQTGLAAGPNDPGAGLPRPSDGVEGDGVARLDRAAAKAAGNGFMIFTIHSPPPWSHVFVWSKFKAVLYHIKYIIQAKFSTLDSG